MMNVEEVRDYCLSLKNTTESFPFDAMSPVFKVENKMYLILSLDAEEPHIAVKCDPDTAIELREHYAAVQPGFHLNKTHWNNIFLQRDMDKADIRQWILHSYQQVLAALPQKIRYLYDSFPL